MLVPSLKWMVIRRSAMSVLQVDQSGVEERFKIAPEIAAHDLRYCLPRTLVVAICEFVEERPCDASESIYQPRVEVIAAALLEYRHRCIVRKRLFIRTPRGERIVHVDDRENARRDRDCVTAQGAAVAAAVEFLVVPSDHGCGVGKPRRPSNDLASVFDVSLHFVELLGRQSGRLEQDTVGNADLA